MGLVSRIESLAAGLETGFLALILLAMVLLSFLQVLLRIFFHGGFIWADPLLRHLVLWAGFLGAALASLEQKHFGWEAAVRGPGRGKAALRLVAAIATAAIAAFLTAASWGYFASEKASGDILMSAGNWNVPVWIFAGAIPGGFALVFLHTTLSCLREAQALVLGKAGSTASF